MQGDLGAHSPGRVRGKLAMPIPEPLSWEQTVALIKDGSIDALSQLGRSQAEYERYMSVKAEVWYVS